VRRARPFLRAPLTPGQDRALLRLSVCVKAGGYAVAGWAVAGDVVVDLCLLNHVDLEPPLTPAPPSADPMMHMGDWTPLRALPALRAAAGRRAGIILAACEGSPRMWASGHK
jgi:hypothetical protein